ncbi:MAG: UDP-2,4-diacetamido-2,4,6-trideoxy-beta-L-altropyranose hydrolase, partial [Proteobacteria bacterium]|nr:UDP-2,4-diacetamido-2,4,6-trideoxy-beta-L-altropyranose hydrolase [Pseudomonadota bacterium]
MVMNPRKIVFRVDASLKIGTGHVMRCLTLAEALRERGCECRFICRKHPGNLIDLISEHGFTAHGLPTADVSLGVGHEPDSPSHAVWLGADWRTDAAQTRKAMGDVSADWLVIDHYAIDERWERELRPVCRRLMVVDDLADRNHDCDLLLDQNLVDGWQDRYRGKVPETCALLLGPEYALLQPVYADLHDRVPPREGPIRRILVYFGGADTDNLTGMTISAFGSLKTDDVSMDVVINPAGPHTACVQELAGKDKRIRLHERLPNLAPLMARADLAIGAGGATSWERCCLGLPSAVITLAENQRPIAAELHKLRIVQCLGHKDEVDEHAMTQVLKRLVENGLETGWSERCGHAVDGKGTSRVGSLLVVDDQNSLSARPATMNDESIVLSWSNFSSTHIKISTKNIPQPTETTKSFRKCLREIDNYRVFIVETSSSIPVSMVCFSRHETSWSIWILHPPHLGSFIKDDMALEKALLALRKSSAEVLIFSDMQNANMAPISAANRYARCANATRPKRLEIAVCTDRGSWINESVPKLILSWLAEGHSVSWSHDASTLPGGDLCFYLSYGRIVDAKTRSRYGNNLVVHASDLPKGRGWSPASWLILEGAERLPVTLLEAVDAVDAGPIYLQKRIPLHGAELIDDWRDLVADATIDLARSFVSRHPEILHEAREQAGDSSSYPRRRNTDSELDSTKTLAEQFNHLRIVDN